jgi:hypothetical protein
VGDDGASPCFELVMGRERYEESGLGEKRVFYRVGARAAPYQSAEDNESSVGLCPTFNSEALGKKTYDRRIRKDRQLSRFALARRRTAGPHIDAY